MTELEETLIDCLMIYKMEDTEMEAIMMLLRTQKQQIKMLEWIASNRKAPINKVIEQAVEIYKEK
jgi:hypothetical protein